MKPSRGMIPAEIVVSLFALSYAWLGGIGWPEPGALFRLIHEKEGPFGSLLWAALLGIPAMVQIAVSMHEWVCYHRCGWIVDRLNQSAIRRSRLILMQLLAWLYMLHVTLLTERRVILLTIHSSIGAAVCAWSYWENRRVRREIKYASRAAAAAA